MLVRPDGERILALLALVRAGRLLGDAPGDAASSLCRVDHVREFAAAGLSSGGRKELAEFFGARDQFAGAGPGGRNSSLGGSLEQLLSKKTGE